MKQFSKFIDFSDKPYVIKADIVDAYMQLMDSIDKRKDFIEPKPYDVSLHVNKDFYDDYGYHIYGACKRIGELLGNDRDVHILFTSIHPMVGKLVLSFHESYISKWPPLGVSPKTYKDIINAVYGKTNVSVFSDKAFSPRIKKVIFNPPATIVYWRDGSKTVSKVQEGDTWDSEKGLAMAIIKKTMGLKEFYKHFDEHAVNANFWHYAAPEELAKKSVYKYGFRPHMDAIVSRYGTDMVKRYLKSIEENGMEEVCQE